MTSLNEFENGIKTVPNKGEGIVSFTCDLKCEYLCDKLENFYDTLFVTHNLKF